MILIITHKEDFTVDFVIEKLNKRSIPYYRLNCEDIYNNPVSSSSDSNFFFNINNNITFKSVWFRRTKLPSINSQINEDEKLFILQDYDSLFENIFQLIDSKKWLSKPQHVFRAENKLLQLNTAKKLGFNIPNTIITNSYSTLEQFFIENNKNVIIKPIRQGRINNKSNFETIFTNKLSNSQIENIRSFDLTPSIFQEYIEKDYEIRVTVVGDKVFSAKINSQLSNDTRIDWRRKKSNFEVYDLPFSIQSLCIKLVNDLGLSFGAIDLIKTKKGEYVFLEINPNGQWAWLEIENKLNISTAIIEYLTSEKKN